MVDIALLTPTFFRRVYASIYPNVTLLMCVISPVAGHFQVMGNASFLHWGF
jgi:hypothetical protein